MALPSACDEQESDDIAGREVAATGIFQDSVESAGGSTRSASEDPARGMRPTGKPSDRAPWGRDGNLRQMLPAP